MGGRRARLGVDEGPEGTASRAKAPCAPREHVRAQSHANAPRTSHAHVAGRAAHTPRCAPRAATRPCRGRPRGATRHRHAGPSSRSRRADTPRPRRAGAGHAEAGGLPGPRHGLVPWPVRPGHHGRGGAPGT
jgi:hypothetical protein